jgi:hypothetical protein
MEHNGGNDVCGFQLGPDLVRCSGTLRRNQVSGHALALHSHAALAAFALATSIVVVRKHCGAGKWMALHPHAALAAFALATSIVVVRTQCKLMWSRQVGGHALVCCHALHGYVDCGCEAVQAK